MIGSGARAPLLLTCVLLHSCATEPRPASATQPRRPPVVQHWGAMREVLREGRSQGRIELLEVLGPNSIAVGASAALAAEITVVSGRAQLAEVVDADSAPGLSVRAPVAGDQATLLVLAQVAEWSEHRLAALPDLAALEASLRELAAAHGIDVTEPFPFRVEGVARHVELHVLDHSCPIAHPEGPRPWRYAGTDEPVTLVGFFAEDAGGVLTHHGRATHTHALLPGTGVSGHLDEVSLADGARLFLPER